MSTDDDSQNPSRSVSSIDAVPTPALVLDAAVVRHNIRRLADYATTHGLSLRPHTKTHKSAMIGGLQLASGSGGLTVAKAGEAEAMLDAFGPDATADILMAYPSVDRPRAERIAAIARAARVRVAVDSRLGLTVLDEAAARHGATVGVLVDLDVGMKRTGVADAGAAVALAIAVDRARHLRLDGIICYPGHVWDPPDRQREPLAAVAARLQEAVDAFDRAGVCRETVSGGSTPTAFRSHLVPQLTEIRPGTYVFNDLNTLRAGFCELSDCAATILCTVVSDAVEGQIVLDGGTKTFTSDLCGPDPTSGHGHVVGHPEAVIHKLTEEHAQVRIAGLPAPPRLGDRVAVIPNHVCPCINLQTTVWWREEDGALHRLAIDARGRLS